MHISQTAPSASSLPGWHGLAQRNPASLASDLLPLLDFAGLLLVSAVLTRLFGPWLLPLGGGGDLTQAALAGSVLAPFMLYDKRFGSGVRGGRLAALARSHALRFTLFAAALLALAAASETLDDIPAARFLPWFAAALLATSLTRLLVGRQLQQLQRQGRLTETVAVIGAGPQAQQFVRRWAGPAPTASSCSVCSTTGCVVPRRARPVCPARSRS